MTLENAIKHAEEVAEREYRNAQVYDKTKNNNPYHPDKITCEQAAKRCRESAAEYRQLAEWLKELKERREQDVPDTNVGNMVSRQAAIDCFWTKDRHFRDALDVIKDIRQLPPAQPEIIRCRDCKYFELDHFEKADMFPFQIPLIAAHEVCMKWGNGCQTSADGWCFMAERRTE